LGFTAHLWQIGGSVTAIVQAYPFTIGMARPLSPDLDIGIAMAAHALFRDFRKG
jgi:hypothetical protein